MLGASLTVRGAARQCFSCGVCGGTELTSLSRRGPLHPTTMRSKAPCCSTTTRRLSQACFKRPSGSCGCSTTVAWSSFQTSFACSGWWVVGLMLISTAR
jgi:hypothetical protein